MVRNQRVRARNGVDILLAVDTICVHGDTPGADRLAASLQAGLENAGIQVAAVTRASASGASAPGDR